MTNLRLSHRSLRGEELLGWVLHQYTLAVLKQNGVPVNSRARQVRLEDLSEFDFVVTMDETNSRNVLALSREVPRAHVARLLDFVPDALEKNVPDPYFSGDFDGVYTLVWEGCARLAQEDWFGRVSQFTSLAIFTKVFIMDTPAYDDFFLYFRFSPHKFATC